MATIPQYQAGKLASRLVGVPIADRSGEIMVESGLENQRRLDSAINAGHEVAQSTALNAVNSAVNFGGNLLKNIQNKKAQAAQLQKQADAANAAKQQGRIKADTLSLNPTVTGDLHTWALGFATEEDNINLKAGYPEQKRKILDNAAQLTHGNTNQDAILGNLSENLDTEFNGINKAAIENGHKVQIANTAALNKSMGEEIIKNAPNYADPSQIERDANSIYRSALVIYPPNEAQEYVKKSVAIPAMKTFLMSKAVSDPNMAKAYIGATEQPASLAAPPAASLQGGVSMNVNTPIPVPTNVQGHKANTKSGFVPPPPTGMPSMLADLPPSMFIQGNGLTPVQDMHQTQAMQQPSTQPVPIKGTIFKPSHSSLNILSQKDFEEVNNKADETIRNSLADAKQAGELNVIATQNVMGRSMSDLTSNFDASTAQATVDNWQATLDGIRKQSPSQENAKLAKVYEDNIKDLQATINQKTKDAHQASLLGTEASLAGSTDSTAITKARDEKISELKKLSAKPASAENNQAMERTQQTIKALDTQLKSADKLTSPESIKASAQINIAMQDLKDQNLSKLKIKVGSDEEWAKIQTAHDVLEKANKDGLITAAKYRPLAENITFKIARWQEAAQAKRTRATNWFNHPQKSADEIASEHITSLIDPAVHNAINPTGDAKVSHDIDSEYTPAVTEGLKTTLAKINRRLQSEGKPPLKDIYSLPSAVIEAQRQQEALNMIQTKGK